VQKKNFHGALVIAGIALAWVGSSQMTQSIQHKGLSAPFFIMWFSTSWEMVCYPLIIIQHCITRTDGEGLSFRRLGINLPIKTVLMRTPVFWALWAAANYMYVRALGMPGFSATLVTAVFSICPAFVFLLSRLLLGEPCNLIRGVAVLLSLGGGRVISPGKGINCNDASTQGVLLTLAAAMAAATYKV